MNASKLITNQTLYDRDYYLWLENTRKQLQDRDLNALDWEHLIEEVEALGNEQRRKVDSYLRQLLIHLLLLRYWEKEKALCTKGWQDEIDDFRYELELLFRSKTLYNYFLQEIEVIYPKARKKAIFKTELPSTIFPDICPFTAEQILDSDYFPE